MAEVGMSAMVSSAAHPFLVSQVRCRISQRFLSSSVLSRGPKGPANTTSTAGKVVSTFKQVPWASWAAAFRREDVPFHRIPVSFSRSSGPGGQNVNKVSTKVELRLPLAAHTAQFIHPGVRSEIRNRHASKVNARDELVITSDAFRTQLQNREDCYDKLYEMILECAHVPTPPAEETLERIDALARAHKEKVKRDKTRLKAKRQDRKIDRYD